MYKLFNYLSNGFPITLCVNLWLTPPMTSDFNRYSKICFQPQKHSFLQDMLPMYKNNVVM